VDLHKGKVSVTSDGEGKGSTFTLELPVYYDAPTDVKEQESKSTVIVEANHADIFESKKNDVGVSHACDLHELRILVVDDAPLNRKMAVRLISGSFAKVGEAVDGYDAVCQVKESMQSPNLCYDVILMDNIMPNMDGPTASKELRAYGYEGLIIGVTGSALPVDINYFINHGANFVLIKPLDLYQLKSLLEENMPKRNYLNDLHIDII